MWVVVVGIGLMQGRVGGGAGATSHHGQQDPQASTSALVLIHDMSMAVCVFEGGDRRARAPY